MKRQEMALFYEERKRICVHSHAPYRGAIPCTGPLACSMCGMLFDDRQELETAQALARAARDKEEGPVACLDEEE